MNYNQKVGKFGEILAKNYLIRQGYGIIETNKKTSYLEIDIIANIKEKLVFIEVKTRTSNIYGAADQAISSKKLKLLKKAIILYINRAKFYTENIRLDLISVDINKRKKIANIKHYKDIF